MELRQAICANIATRSTFAPRWENHDICDNGFDQTKAHRVLHRPDDYCQPFIVKRDPVVGRFFFFPPFTIIYDFKYAGSDVWIRVARYTVASRDIPACQLILREDPAVHGPYTKTTPVCLSCYAKVMDHH